MQTPHTSKTARLQTADVQRPGAITGTWACRAQTPLPRSVRNRTQHRGQRIRRVLGGLHRLGRWERVRRVGWSPLFTDPVTGPDVLAPAILAVSPSETC